MFIFYHLYCNKQVIHYVECLDRYFGNVCELDIIFNFDKAYYILDEILIDGKLQETSQRIILKSITTQDSVIDNSPDSRDYAI
ncbi:ap complex subunit sigma [Anaeramoeba ignava]|uniref:Ap complex subunit sigma n=1 Tax=Anaeramoeba ignava TaxID=1746090 RepID=A0A9Q0LUI2_ANAIG|nr:ap complex subunit sigma [Anaeramoeba ignava]